MEVVRTGQRDGETGSGTLEGAADGSTLVALKLFLSSELQRRF